MELEEIVETFEALDDGEDQLRFLIDLGKRVEGLPADQHTEDNRVHGCQSKVWMVARVDDGRLALGADSDAFVVRGLVAILLAIYQGKTPAEAAVLDPAPVLGRMGLEAHLSMGRRNGLWSMVQRIRKLAIEAA
jgi:cysteine desulfuration protein SufE